MMKNKTKKYVISLTFIFCMFGAYTSHATVIYNSQGCGLSDWKEGNICSFNDEKEIILNRLNKKLDNIRERFPEARFLKLISYRDCIKNSESYKDLEKCKMI